MPSPRERGRPPRTPRPKAGSLEASQAVDVYEALKLQQPAEVQQQIELEELFWDARELEVRQGLDVGEVFWLLHRGDMLDGLCVSRWGPVYHPGSVKAPATIFRSQEHCSGACSLAHG